MAVPESEYALTGANIAMPVGGGWLSIAPSALTAKVVIGDDMADAIKEKMEPWLYEQIKEIIANTPMPLPPIPPAITVPDKPLGPEAMASVQSLVYKHEGTFHPMGVQPAAPSPILINEFSIPYDIQNYRPVLRSAYGGQEYEVPMNLLPKLLGKVLS